MQGTQPATPLPPPPSPWTNHPPWSQPSDTPARGAVLPTWDQASDAGAGTAAHTSPPRLRASHLAQPPLHSTAGRIKPPHAHLPVASKADVDAEEGIAAEAEALLEELGEPAAAAAGAWRATGEIHPPKWDALVEAGGTGHGARSSSSSTSVGGNGWGPPHATASSVAGRAALTLDTVRAELSGMERTAHELRKSVFGPTATVPAAAERLRARVLRRRQQKTQGVARQALRGWRSWTEHQRIVKTVAAAQEAEHARWAEAHWRKNMLRRVFTVVRDALLLPDGRSGPVPSGLGTWALLKMVRLSFPALEGRSLDRPILARVLDGPLRASVFAREEPAVSDVARLEEAAAGMDRALRRTLFRTWLRVALLRQRARAKMQHAQRVVSLLRWRRWARHGPRLRLLLAPFLVPRPLRPHLWARALLHRWRSHSAAQQRPKCRRALLADLRPRVATATLLWWWHRHARRRAAQRAERTRRREAHRMEQLRTRFLCWRAALRLRKRCDMAMRSLAAARRSRTLQSCFRALADIVCDLRAVRKGCACLQAVARAERETYALRRWQAHTGHARAQRRARSTLHRLGRGYRLAHCWSQWARHAYVQRAGRRFARRRRLFAGIEIWRDRWERRRSMRLAEALCAKRFRIAALRRATRTWTLALPALRQATRLMAGARARGDAVRYARALDKWAAHVRRRREQRRMEGAALAVRSRRSLRMWREWIGRERRLRQVLDRVDVIQLRMLARKVLRTWLRHRRERVAVRRSAVDAMARWRGVEALRQWARRAEAGQRGRALATHGVAVWARKRALAALARLRARAQSRRRTRALLEEASARWAQRAGEASLAVWHDLARRRRQVRVVARRTIVQWRSHAGRGAIAQWQRRAASLRRSRGQSRRARSHARLTLQRKTLHRLRRASLLAKSVTKQVDGMARRASLGRAGRAFRAWRLHLAAQRRALWAERAASRHDATRRVANAFAAWVDRAEGWSQRREAFATAESHHTRRRLLGALDQFLAYGVRRRRARDLGHRSRYGTLLVSFRRVARHARQRAAWRNAVLEARLPQLDARREIAALGRALLQMARHAARRRQERALCAAMNAWRGAHAIRRWHASVQHSHSVRARTIRIWQDVNDRKRGHALRFLRQAVVRRRWGIAASTRATRHRQRALQFRTVRAWQRLADARRPLRTAFLAVRAVRRRREATHALRWLCQGTILAPRADAHFADRLRRRVFAAWGNEAHALREAARKQRLADSLSARHRLTRAVRALDAYRARCSHLRAFTASVVDMDGRFALQRCFMGWRRAVLWRAAALEMESRAAAACSDLARRGTLRRWRRVVSQRRWLKQWYAGRRREHRRALLRTVFRALLQGAARIRDIRRIAEHRASRAKQRREAETGRVVFHQLHATAQHMRWSRARADAFQRQHIRPKLLRAPLRAWAAHAHMAAVAERHAAHHERQRLARSVMEWRIGVRRKRARVMGRGKSLRRAVACWCQVADARRSCRALGLLIDRHRVRRAVRLWGCVVAMRQARVAALADASARLQRVARQRTVVRAFGAWMGELERTRWVERKGREAWLGGSPRRHGRRQRLAILTWRSWSARHRHLRTSGRITRETIRGKRLYLACSHWRAQAQGNRVRARAGAAVARRRALRIVTSALDTWRGEVAAARMYRARTGQETRGGARVVAAFGAWRRRALMGRRAAELLVRLQQKRVRGMLRAWWTLSLRSARVRRAAQRSAAASTPGLDTHERASAPVHGPSSPLAHASARPPLSVSTLTPRQRRWEEAGAGRDGGGPMRVEDLASHETELLPFSPTVAAGAAPGPTGGEEDAAVSTFTRARRAVSGAGLRAMLSGWRALTMDLADARRRSGELAARRVEAMRRAAFRSWRELALAAMPSPQAEEVVAVASARVATMQQRRALDWWHAVAVARARRRWGRALAERRANARRGRMQRELLRQWGRVASRLGAARVEAECRFRGAHAARAHTMAMHYFRTWRAAVLTPSLRTLRAMAVEHAELVAQRHARGALSLWSGRARRYLAARSLNARVLERLMVRYPPLADVSGDVAEFMEVRGWFVRGRVRTVRGAILALRVWREAPRVPGQKVARIASLLTDARDKLRNIIREQHEERRAPHADGGASAVKLSGPASAGPLSRGTAGVVLPPEGVQLPTPRRESSPEAPSPALGSMRQRFQDILDAPLSSEVQRVPIHWAGHLEGGGAQEEAEHEGHGATPHAAVPALATAPSTAAGAEKRRGATTRRSSGAVTRRKRSASPKPLGAKKAASVRGGKRTLRRTPSPARRTKVK